MECLITAAGMGTEARASAVDCQTRVWPSRTSQQCSYLVHVLGLDVND
jgi:hypothetical protein